MLRSTRWDRVDILPPGLERRLLEELPPEPENEPEVIRDAREEFHRFPDRPIEEPGRRPHRR